MSKRISIVTVVYKDLRGLKATYRSLLLQDFTDFEWVVVDGGSGSEFLEFIGADLGLDVNWVSESDKGIYDAMNKGLSMAKGDFIVFLNAGDSFSSSSVLSTVTKNADVPNVDVIYGGANFIFQTGSLYRGPKCEEHYLWHGLPANHQATYFRRNSILAIPYDLSYKICGDYYIVAKLSLTKPTIVYIDEPLVDFQIGGRSFKTPIALFLEPYKIQKNILQINLLRRVRSMGRRLVSYLAISALATKPFPKLLGHLRLTPVGWIPKER